MWVFLGNSLGRGGETLCGQEVNVEMKSVPSAGCSEDPGSLWSSPSFLLLPLLSCRLFPPAKPEASP